MMKRLLGITALCVGLSMAASGIGHAQCVPESVGDLFLDPTTTIPAGEPSALFMELPNMGTVVFPPRGGAAVVGIRALPPKLVEPANEAQPGVHYSACLDASTGSGSLTMGFSGGLFVRVEYAGGSHDFFLVSAMSELHGDPPVCVGGLTEFPTEAGSLVLTSKGLADKADHHQRPDQTYKEVNSVDDVGNAVLNTPSNIDLVIDTHGNTNGIRIGREDVTLGNLDKLVEKLGGSRVRLRFKKIKLLGCNVGSDKGNKKFAEELAKKTGITVEAAPGSVQPQSIPGNEAATFTHCTTGPPVTFNP